MQAKARKGEEALSQAQECRGHVLHLRLFNFFIWKNAHNKQYGLRYQSYLHNCIPSLEVIAILFCLFHLIGIDLLYA